MPSEGLIYSDFADHILFSCFGIVISVYSLYIEIRKEKDKNYRAACDFNEHMSCSRVLTSKYSKGFGVVEILFGKEHVLNMPNCILGIIFYSMQLLLGLFTYYWATQLLFFCSVASCFGSLYLAYILFAVLHDFCLVCVTTYGVNAALTYLNYQAYYYH